MSATSSTPDPATGQPVKPAIILVHGAWADSSSWSPVIDRLRGAGYPVRAIASPLQGLTRDTAYATSYLATIDGPKVLVGHSYGGAIITNAATAVPEVKSLVYIAASSRPRARPSVNSPPSPPPRCRWSRLRFPTAPRSSSTRPNSARRSPATSTRPPRPTSRSPSGRPTPRPSPTPARWRVTSPSPRGTSSPPRTTPSTRTCSASWPPAPTHASPRSPPRTQSCSATPTPLQTSSRKPRAQGRSDA